MVHLRITIGNAFGYISVQNAYKYGCPWLEELLKVIESNYHFLKETLYRELPEIWMSDLQATYLTWIDLGKYLQPEEVEKVVLSECKLAVDFGSWFGGEKYAGFIRINLATSEDVIRQTAENIIRVLKNRREWCYGKY